MKPVIEVNHVSKKFCKDLRHTIKYGFVDIGKSLFGLKTDSDRLRPEEFWALDNISFKLKKGETLGIIGPNGSGKTTLLKLLNGIMMPDKGKVTVKGKVGALIAIGAGFHPMLTGRENIYINGAILGMSKNEIDEKFDKIVQFADIGDFLDAPVKTYSSGMNVRLGFSIAIHSSPDILLIDEILAVGDYDFQRKCFEKMREKVKDGITLILVSHAVGNILSGTSKSLLLSHGKTVIKGGSRKVVKRYINELNTSVASKKKQLMTQFRRGSGEVRIINAFITNMEGNKMDEIPVGMPIKIRCLFKVFKPIKNPTFFFIIRDVVTKQAVLFASSENIYHIDELNKNGEFVFIFKKPNIAPRAYYLCGGIVSGCDYNAPVDMWDDAGDRFTIKHPYGKKSTDIKLIADPLIELPFEFKINLKNK